MAANDSSIPAFRADGYLPEGLHLASEAELRRPEELFAAEDEEDWNAWIDFFSRTREADGRRKGIVEVEL